MTYRLVGHIDLGSASLSANPGVIAACLTRGCACQKRQVFLTPSCIFEQSLSKQVYKSEAQQPAKPQLQTHSKYTKPRTVKMVALYNIAGRQIGSHYVSSTSPLLRISSTSPYSIDPDGFTMDCRENANKVSMITACHWRSQHAWCCRYSDFRRIIREENASAPDQRPKSRRGEFHQVCPCSDVCH